ncbi:hypothetical protein V1477_020529 [Vespula maculifrons]|uniref:Uncharacterized protein n=1 Tax=Vespula maculifrons TaxID=7453 RepID=A0ABD2AM62_VESMC
MSGLRNFRGCHSCINEELIQIYKSLFDFRLRCEVGILGFERRQQSLTSSVVLWTSTREHRNFRTLGDFEILSPQVNLEIFVDAIRVSINEELIQIYKNLNAKWGYSASNDDNKLCFGLRRVNLENIAVPTRISTDEQLIQIYNSLFDFRLRCEVGILGFERRQQSLTSSVVLWTSTREHRNFRTLGDFEILSPQVNLEIFADAIRVSINEELIQIYKNLNAKWGYSASNDDNKLCFGLRRVNLENIAVPTRISTDEQLIQIYNSLFDFRLKCEVGIVGFERRQQSWALKQHL